MGNNFYPVIEITGQLLSANPLKNGLIHGFNAKIGSREFIQNNWKYGGLVLLPHFRNNFGQFLGFNES